MPITQTPSSVVPALWTYTYLQAPIDGQGKPYFNIPSQFTDLGTKTSGTLTLDLGTANVFKVIAGGAFTVAFSNIAPTANTAQFWQLEIKGGGSYVQTWPASVIWDGGGASNISPVLSLDTTVLNFYTRNNGTTVYGSYAYSDLKI
jgi:hypothetical protein